MRLDGKVAIVTGAARGLGRAYAEALAAAGAEVVVNDVDEAVREVARVAEVCPVGSTEAADAWSSARWPSSAAWTSWSPTPACCATRSCGRCPTMTSTRVVDTHLRGTFTCARAAAIRMRAQEEGGRIIVVGSPAGQYGNFGQTNYSAAKAGIVAFARTWAMELARAQITVNAIVPTAWTRMTASIPIYAPLVDRDEFPPAVRQEHALGGPEDCAPLVVFLASDAAAGVTGQAIGIGGDRLSLYSHPAEVAFELRDGRLERGRDRRRVAVLRPAAVRRAAAGAGPVVNVDELVAIDVHTHAERNDGRRAGPGHDRGAGGGGRVLRRLAAAADRAGGRRLLPRAAAWRR